MKRIFKNDLEKSIKSSIDILTFKNLSPIKEMKFEEKKRNMNKKYIKVIISACILIGIAVAFGINYYNSNLRVTSKITFDVNPSILLSMNKQNMVIDFEALNDDGSKILENLDLEEYDAETATNKIVSELINQGYLAGDAANILLTVQNNDLSLAKDMESKLTTLINDELAKSYIAGTVMTQIDTVKQNIPEAVQNIMDTYDVSYSKAIFLRNLLRKDSSLDISVLAKYSISEITRVVHNKNITLDDIINYDKSKSLYEESATEQLRKEQDLSSEIEKKIEEKSSSIKKELDEASKNNDDLSSIKEKYSTVEKEKNSAIKKANDAKSEYQKAKNNKN